MKITDLKCAIIGDNPVVRIATEEEFVEVWDSPGLGVEFIVEEVKRDQSEDDRDFFD